MAAPPLPEPDTRSLTDFVTSATAELACFVDLANELAADPKKPATALLLRRQSAADHEQHLCEVAARRHRRVTLFSAKPFAQAPLIQVQVISLGLAERP
jgi:hypothetical protein